MTSFRTSGIFAGLQSVVLLICCGAAFAQGNAASPEQVRASMAGMTKDEIRQKYMGMAKGIRFATVWPTNFPLPQYTSNVVETKFSYSTKGKSAAVATVFTQDQPQTAFQWYMDACRRGGWAVKTPSAKVMANARGAGKFFMLDGTREKQTIRIFCTPSARKAATMVSITWVKLNK